MASAARARVEWPTMALIAALLAAWVGLCVWHDAVPVWAWLAASAWVCAWWGSVQHEAIHGHPTRFRRLNALLVGAPFTLWLPFARYRATHLSHHRDEFLTDPLEDSESRYWTIAEWQAVGRVGRGLVRAQATLLGRVLIGPFWSIPRFWLAEWRLVRRGHRGARRAWAWHAGPVTLVLAFAVGFCGVPAWQYVLGFTVLATSLTLVRSFAEHRAAETPAQRTAIVEGHGPLAWLFLFNNLHLLHHREPRLAWYRLPAAYRAQRAALAEANGGLVYQGYGEVARRFLVRAHDAPLHPSRAGQAGSG
jgi:fatty acid desaturase